MATIVVEHPDRLARFGLGHVEKALGADRRKLVVVKPGEVEDDLVRDVIDLIASFSTWLYGRRSIRKAKKAMAELRP